MAAGLVWARVRGSFMGAGGDHHPLLRRAGHAAGVAADLDVHLGGRDPRGLTGHHPGRRERSPRPSHLGLPWQDLVRALCFPLSYRLWRTRQVWPVVAPEASADLGAHRGFRCLLVSIPRAALPPPQAAIHLRAFRPSSVSPPFATAKRAPLSRHLAPAPRRPNTAPSAANPAGRPWTR